MFKSIVSSYELTPANSLADSRRRTRGNLREGTIYDLFLMSAALIYFFLQT